MSSTDEKVKTIESMSEFKELVNKTKYVAVQAHAEWCGPCKAISPRFKKQAETYASPNYAFASFDIDLIPDLAQEFAIRSIPAFFFFKDGDKVNQVVGANPDALEKTIKQFAETEGTAT